MLGKGALVFYKHLYFLILLNFYFIYQILVLESDSVDVISCRLEREGSLNIGLLRVFYLIS